ncbi:carboxymuconolactone decarboxylase family protein [Phenylobacterium sp.]|uniref:carboxymuconolactone decarboxylase family protein n=1 Tax=Phenylobacterium sp. TaxID=1871053 RepID=UPI0025E94FBB|nr:carboxymuconolactone decarboxylase family protein [Phenylobacterium sp.]
MRTAIILAGLLMATSASAKDRFPVLTPEQMTPAQKALADAIQAGPRKTLNGPFNAWLRSPAMGDRMQQLGEQIRFHSSVPRKLNEFAILITARAWNASYEWYAHYPLALQAGLEPAVAADLAQGRRPRGMTPDEAAVYDFATELRRDRKVGDATFAAVQTLLGDQGVIDLIAVNGYYDMVSMTLNVAQVPTPDGGALPLPNLEAGK